MTISPFSILARADSFVRNKIANYREQTRLANERHAELTAQQAQSDHLARESANSIATLAQPTDAVAAQFVEALDSSQQEIASLQQHAATPYQQVRDWLDTACVDPILAGTPVPSAYLDNQDNTQGTNGTERSLLAQLKQAWIFGHWEQLTNINFCTLDCNPNKSVLALLIAAGHMERGVTADAKKYIHLAAKWGCSELLIRKFVISSFHNFVGQLAYNRGREAIAIEHFLSAITLDTIEQPSDPIPSQRVISRKAISANANNSLYQKSKHDGTALNGTEKTLYFHIGTPKTGTTSLQFFLWRNSETLKKYDANYFDILEPRLDLPRYANADFLLTDSRRLEDATIANKIEQTVERKILISDEGLWANIEVVERACFNNYPKIIIIYVRRPAEMIASWAGEYSKPYNGYLKEELKGPGVASILDCIELCTQMYTSIFRTFFQKISGMKNTNIMFRAYERASLHRNDVTLDFLQIIQLTGDFAVVDEFSDKFDGNNESYSRKFSDISYLTWEYMTKHSMQESYTLELVESVYKSCESGDDRGILDTLPDSCIERITAMSAWITDKISAEYFDGNSIFECLMPRIYKIPRAQYQAPDIVEVHGAIERFNRSHSVAGAS